MTPDRLSDAVERLLGSAVLHARPLHGGDLSQVARLTLSDGRNVVAKTGPLVATEARMLQAMARRGAPVPEVLAAESTLLLLAYLDETPASPAGWHKLGTTLRHLHAQSGESYGWPEDYAFGAVAIRNSSCSNWPSFWADHRLLADLRTLPPEIAHRLEPLVTRLPDLLPATPPPAFLHGDLWSGNVLFDRNEKAWLVDPACYFGHSEVDLAMLLLFAAPPDKFWQGYGAPDPGWRTRLPIYQLWPALVHLKLFGSTYQALVTRLLNTLKV
ncbi:fructosamine kinase family protein [Shimia aestuarii]|uniref:Fructosamine-3-kinase n=1 Tax=Shimia aestuarii TaxID=254406 RepID=A0A1I4IMX8_9RHOB|nr:fructosamine kinase family protein [Shimia aestuarii]SFL55353.1 Fructosamine-3-kinase [Shimia aestuarii]